MCTSFNIVAESFILPGQQQHLRCGLFSRNSGRIYLGITFCFFQGFPLPLILKTVLTDILYIWQKELCITVFPAADVVFSPNLVLTTCQTSLVAVRWASKKSGGSSKNLGGRSPGKRYGFKKVEGRSGYLICISLGSSQLLSPGLCQFSVSAGGGQGTFPGEGEGEDHWNLMIQGPWWACRVSQLPPPRAQQPPAETAYRKCTLLLTLPLQRAQEAGTLWDTS